MRQAHGKRREGRSATRATAYGVRRGEEGSETDRPEKASDKLSVPIFERFIFPRSKSKGGTTISQICPRPNSVPDTLNDADYPRSRAAGSPPSTRESCARANLARRALRLGRPLVAVHFGNTGKTETGTLKRNLQPSPLCAMSAAAFAKVLEVDEDDLTRNDRLLNLRELDCEIKERELKLAEHLKDLEMREAAVTQRKRDIAAELQYELGLELEKVRAHEELVVKRKELLELEVSRREQMLARREILVAEREWILRAKEDSPKGFMGAVFANLDALGKENDKNCQTNRTHLDNTSTSGMPLFVENSLFVGTVDEETVWLNARIDDMVRNFPNNHIPPTDCPYKTDISFFTISVRDLRL